MVLVLLNEADFEYDIHSLVKAFFPKEEVKVSADAEKKEKFRNEGTPSFEMEVLFERQANAIEIRMRHPQGTMPGGMMDQASPQKDAAVVEPRTQADSQAVRADVDFSDRKETKNRLKRAIYRLLSAYTGRELPWGTLTGIRPTKIPMAMLEEGHTPEECAKHMEEAYGCSHSKAVLSTEIAQREHSLLQKLDYETGYSLYVGIPFCPSTCLYCSFTSFPISAWESKTELYLDTLERELDFVSSLCQGRRLNTVYIGGGTPTSLSAAQLGRLLSKMEDSFDLSGLLEFTVEAGRPDSITGEKLETLLRHGISRISINPQTMKQETLDIIGRRHTVEQTVESYRMAREYGFDNINMDLIMGLPNEDIEDVRHTMEALKELAPDSITVHSLAIKRAARLNMFRENYKDLRLENTNAHIEMTAEYCRQMGLEPYYLYRQKNMAGNFENVGYAKPGKAGLYNILIMEQKQDIIAVGAGSSSKRVFPDGTIGRCENVKEVAQYIERIDEMIERKRALFCD